MNAAPTTPKPQRRFRRTIAILFYSTLLIWLTYITASRWNGVPADTSETSVYELPPRVPLDPELDRTAELVAALDDLPPPLEDLGLTSTYMSPLIIAPIGPWTPETRPYLQMIIDHLETPAVQAALARFAAIQPGVCCLMERPLREMRRVGDILLARARYDHTGRGDIDAAINDMEIMMRLAVTLSASPSRGCYESGWGIAGEAQYEIMLMAFEKQLSQAQAERLIAALRLILPDEHTMWRQYVDIVTSENLALLDQSYTIDKDGNGWLVLSRLDNILGRNRPDREDRPRLWNALSPLFNSRRTVAAKIACLRRKLEDADRLSPLGALKELDGLDQNRSFNELDGPPFYWVSDAQFLRERQKLASHIAQRHATILAIALSAYKAEHGEYPSSLEPLLDTYLDAIPFDPYSDKPLRYFRKAGEDDYVLYSVGADLIDNTAQVGCPHSWRTEDLFFEHHRWNYALEKTPL